MVDIKAINIKYTSLVLSNFFLDIHKKQCLLSSRILSNNLKIKLYKIILPVVLHGRRRWEDNIRMDLEEIGINAGNWVDSAQGRNYWRALVNAALNLRVP